MERLDLELLIVTLKNRALFLSDSDSRRGLREAEGEGVREKLELMAALGRRLGLDAAMEDLADLLEQQKTGEAYRVFCRCHFCRHLGPAGRCALCSVTLDQKGCCEKYQPLPLLE